ESFGRLLQDIDSWLPSSVVPFAPPNVAMPHVVPIDGDQLRAVASGTVHDQTPAVGLYASTRVRSREPSQPPITYIGPSGPVTADGSSCGAGIGGSVVQPAARLFGSSENASRRGPAE